MFRQISALSTSQCHLLPSSLIHNLPSGHTEFLADPKCPYVHAVHSAGTAASTPHISELIPTYPSELSIGITSYRSFSSWPLNGALFCPLCFYDKTWNKQGCKDPKGFPWSNLYWPPPTSIAQGLVCWFKCTGQDWRISLFCYQKVLSLKDLSFMPSPQLYQIVKCKHRDVGAGSKPTYVLTGSLEMQVQSKNIPSTRARQLSVALAIRMDCARFICSICILPLL